MPRYKDPLPIIAHPSIMNMIRSHVIEHPELKKDFHFITSLYFWLYETARRQGNNQVYAEVSFLERKLFCGRNRVKRTKAILHELELIDYKKKLCPEKGRVVTYIKVNHVWGANGVLSLLQASQLNEMKEFLIDGFGNGVICTGENIGEEEIFIDINGSEHVSTFVQDIYFNEDEMLCTNATINGGSEIEHIFRVDESPVILEKVYNYAINRHGIHTP